MPGYYARSSGRANRYMRRGLTQKTHDAFIGGLNSHFTSLYGGDPMAKLGHSALDHNFSRGISQYFGNVGRFSRTDYLRRKVPIIAPASADASKYYRDRLRVGQNDLTGGHQDASMEGIERNQLNE